MARKLCKLSFLWSIVLAVIKKAVDANIAAFLQSFTVSPRDATQHA